MSSPSKSVGAAFILVAAIVLAVSGCGELDHPSSPSSGTDNIRLFRESKVILGSDHVVKLVRADEGGKVSLNRHTVIIPPGALKNDTEISISEPDPGYVLADFGPEELRFSRPVELAICYRELDLGDVSEDALTIYWYNSRNKRWVDLNGNVDKSGQIVRAWTDHFSRYALSDH
ncbi:MAG: hypothetical protein ACE5JA_09940 [bacterium]